MEITICVPKFARKTFLCFIVIDFRLSMPSVCRRNMRLQGQLQCVSNSNRLELATECALLTALKFSPYGRFRSLRNLRNRLISCETVECKQHQRQIIL